jgi:hypothetical protein
MSALSLAEMVHHREQYAESDQHSEPEPRSDHHSVVCRARAGRGAQGRQHHPTLTELQERYLLEASKT